MMRPLLASIAVSVSALGTPLVADTYGLVIGIDAYDHIPDLQGAVNDARDIAAALEDMDAEVTLLLDGAATREAIFAAWRDIAAKVEPGDRFVISYAGHGSNEPAAHPETEIDGLDENFLLAGFAPVGADAAERIRDDEIATLLALTPDAQVIFVADACHSGTVSRNITPVLGYRYVENGVLSDDPLPPPPPPPGGRSEGRDDVALFLAAVDETAKVPEFLIEGRPRGALSFAFARGLRGAADADRDSELTKEELAFYVRRSVRQISQGVQAPEVSPAGRGAEILFSLRSGGDTVISQDVFSLSFDALPRLTLAHDGDAGTDLVLGRLDGIDLVGPGDAASLVYESDSGSLKTMVGDVVRVLGRSDSEDFGTVAQVAIDKMRIAAALETAARNSALAVTFGGGDKTYRTDEIVEVQVLQRQSEHLALFAISSDGSMSFLYPIQDPAAGLNDPLSVTPTETLDLPLKVTPPYGADHLIAFETANDSPDLRAALAAAEQQGDLRTFWDLLRGAAVYMTEPPTVAIFPFYTTRS